MSYIDVHCHLDGNHYGDMPAFFNSLMEADIRKIIGVGFDLPSSILSKAYAESFEGVYFSAGLHPTELKGYTLADLYKIEALLAHKKCVALGEIGLDYHYDDTDKPKQKQFFIAQLELAYATKMPIQIHSRDCAEDMINILSEHSQKLYYGAMLHCYSHSVELAERFLSLGCHFSFGGTSTYKGSKKAQRTICALGMKNILTETDSPYLPPKSKAGVFPNTPHSIPEITANIAQLKGIEEESAKQIIWDNAHRLFPKLN